MYTVKCESWEGVYYLVPNWEKNRTFFVRDIPSDSRKLFKREQDAKRDVTMLLKVMDDYKSDKFTIIELQEALTMRKYYKTFTFCNSLEEARAFCDSYNANATEHMRRNHPAHFTPWISQDGNEKKYICWYYQ